MIPYPKEEEKRMVIDYQTQGVCSQRMLIDVEDGVVRSLQVLGG